MTYIYKEIKSPIGKLTLVANNTNLVGIIFENGKLNKLKLNDLQLGNNSILNQTEHQLDEYFNKKRKIFELPLEFHGTEFQKNVWIALKSIPSGQVSSYQEIAVKVGSPRACRAVGAANGENPIPIIIPCHRVIGKNGKLVGFGGGLKTKTFLLNLEGHNFNSELYK